MSCHKVWVIELAIARRFLLECWSDFLAWVNPHDRRSADSYRSAIRIGLVAFPRAQLNLYAMFFPDERSGFLGCFVDRQARYP